MQTQNSFGLEGKIVDVENREVFEGAVLVENGIIKAIERRASANSDFILPGLIDAHVHVESSLLIPSEFVRLAVPHGTVGTVSDPHEIGNVLGVKGVEYMLQNGSQRPFKFCFGAPSCVPATDFETAGAVIGLDGVEQLMSMPGIGYLAEVMNFPGVLSGDDLMMAKIEVARRLGKPIDGHAPGLRGDEARRYIEAGISTDHECFTAAEALDKIRCGMKILIREGSAAKNFDALIDLIGQYPDFIMFCSDDKHPDSLVAGHINQLVKRAIDRGHAPMDVIRAATLNPIKHYGMGAGLLRVGDPADMIVVDDLKSFNVKQTYIDGQKVAEGGKSLLQPLSAPAVNNFHCNPISADQLRINANGGRLRVIDVIPGELITRGAIVDAKVKDGELVSDPSRDILKLVVLNRYQPGAAPAIAFVRNVGLQSGALASSVAHDSHNIVAVGVSDDDIAAAINEVVAHEGGLSLARGSERAVLPLPVAGLMSNQDGYVVADQYTKLDQRAKALGSTLPAPYMTLSFLALLVIPELKLSDKGLFDGKGFSFCDLQP